MKQNIDREKSLEQLENDFWSEPEYPSSLVINCHKYRKIPLKELSTENLRLLIGQNIGNDYLMPLAIESLKKDILISGDYYDGDLLKVVLTSDEKFWKAEPEMWIETCKLVRKNLLRITDKGILDAFSLFEKIPVVI